MAGVSSTFVWRPSYSVGVPEIDGQHQELVRIINEVHEAMVLRKAGAELAVLMQELLEYTQNHFLHEERLMIQTRYPAALSHRDEHDRMRKAVSEFQRDLDAGKSGLALRLMSFLKDWLIRHIQASDRELGRYLAAALLQAR